MYFLNTITARTKFGSSHRTNITNYNQTHIHSHTKKHFGKLFICMLANKMYKTDIMRGKKSVLHFGLYFVSLKTCENLLYFSPYLYAYSPEYKYYKMKQWNWFMLVITTKYLTEYSLNGCKFYIKKTFLVFFCQVIYIGIYWKHTHYKWNAVKRKRKISN